MTIPVPWQFLPGIQRDGTPFASKAYGDGLWCRWERALPRKMFGYQLLSNNFSDIPREIYVFPRGDTTFIHVGSGSFLEAIELDLTGAPGGVYDRTPTVGFTADDANDWQFDTIYDSAGTETVLVAHAAPNLVTQANSTEGPYFIGDVTGTAVLAEVVGSDVSGGIVVLQPYTFRYGDSILAWSDANLPDTLSGGDAGEARVSGLKIIKGLPLRGNGVGPAGLFWSLNSLIRATYNGGSTIFAFDTISSDISVISASSIMEHDGIYYWPGLDRFQMFNGVVREIPNNMSINYFFENLNRSAAAKTYAHKVPRFGEIWWCFPSGDSDECNHALILNVREGGIWYDTPLPQDFRSASAYAQVYPYPVMGGALTDPSGLTNYCLWQHEIGLDDVQGSESFAIRSYFKTSNMSFLEGGKNNDLSLQIVEWDAIQSGDLLMTVYCQQNARAPEITAGSETIVEDDGNLPAADQVVRFKISGRNVSFQVESNTLGGDYQLGKVFCQVDADGERITQ